AEQLPRVELGRKIIMLAVPARRQAVELDRAAAQRMRQIAADLIGLPYMALAEDIVADRPAIQRDDARLVDRPGVDGKGRVDMRRTPFLRLIGPSERSGLVRLAAVPEDVPPFPD